MIRFFILAFALLAAPLRADIEIKEVTSPGGIEAWLVEAPEIPMVSLEILIEGGASLDRPGKRGAANLMTALIEEGSGDMDARAFQAARESLAASFGFRVYDDSLSITAQFLTENQEEAIALLRQALTDPRFDQDAIDRVRAQVISGIRADALDPDTIASETFNALAYGDHPYGTPQDGTIESVEALTQEDMFQSHRDLLVRDRVYVGAAGDITPEALGEMLDTLLGDLPEGGPDLPEEVAITLEGGKTVVDFETPQSVAIFGHEGIERDDPDFFAAFILNEILGGRGLDSRLMDEVREARGLTYGVYSFLVPRQHAEVYLGSVASANDRIAEAIEVIKAEWRRMAEEGVTPEELEEAKTYLTGAYPLRFDGNANIAGILVGMQITDLTPDYVANRNDFIEAVTLEEINRVAAELLRPDDLHFVVVGQPEGLEVTQ